MFVVQALKSYYLSICWASKHKYVENLEDPMLTLVSQKGWGQRFSNLRTFRWVVSLTGQLLVKS